MHFNKWLDTLIEEKGIDAYTVVFDGYSDNGYNYDYRLKQLEIID